MRRPAAQRLRRSKGSAKWRLRAVRAPAELAETGPERSGAETERCRSGDGAGARAVPKRRSERSIPKSREAATAFSPSQGGATRGIERGKRRRAYGSAQRRLRRSLRRRCRNGAGPGARKPNGRECGRAARSSPLSPPFSVGRRPGAIPSQLFGELTGLFLYRFHPSYSAN